jgi:hypothetical protein
LDRGWKFSLKEYTEQVLHVTPREFWNWQFGDQAFGRSFICLDDDGTIVGHVGANFGENLSWIINVFLMKHIGVKVF